MALDSRFRGKDELGRESSLKMTPDGVSLYSGRFVKFRDSQLERDVAVFFGGHGVALGLEHFQGADYLGTSFGGVYHIV